MTPAEQIALWADKLRDISAMGLLFSKSIHDEAAFRAVQTMQWKCWLWQLANPWSRLNP